MLKILKILLFIPGSLALVFFLNESSPIIAIEAADKKIHTTVFIFCLALLMLVIISYIVIKALYSVINLPFTMKKNYRNKLNESKFLSLVNLWIAKEQMDNNQFKRALSFLIAADIPEYVKKWLNYQKNLFQHSNNVRDLEKLTQHPETSNLAIMQLIKTEIALNNTQSAFNHLKNLNSSISNQWRCAMIIKICFKENLWNDLMQFLAQEKYDVPDKGYLIDICHYKTAREIYNSRISFEKLKEAISILDKVKSSLPPAIYLKTLLLIKLNEYEAAIQFINKNWTQFSYVLLYPTLLLLSESNQQLYNKVFDRMITNNVDLAASIILTIYRAIIINNTDTAAKLLNQYRYQINEQYTYFFEYYYKYIKQDKILLELFTENLRNMIEKVDFYYDFDCIDGNADRKIIDTIPSLKNQKLPAALIKEST